MPIIPGDHGINPDREYVQLAEILRDPDREVVAHDINLPEILFVASFHALDQYDIQALVGFDVGG